MVATTDCDRSKAMSSSSKVSKPLMEKKRRARINQCLDQLKSLLENHYNSTIRKRKLEKADILELTVRYLKHLQKMQKFSSVAPDSEYHAGFRSCVSSVNYYLLTADHVGGADRWRLSQLTSRLSTRRPEEAGSTVDSVAHCPGAKPVPSPGSGPKEDTATCSPKVYSSTSGLRKQGQTCSRAAPEQKNKSAAYTVHGEVLNDQINVWRPW